MNMPKVVTITRSFTYDVEEVINTLKEVLDTDSPTWEDVEELINGWVHDDMSSNIGRNELVWTDEEGNEL